ncbi:cell division protein FtsQ/DivIB [Salegentibacter chungangensis]|uniref:Cell division protein FtsQ/DivIB n=1 Tax=Salegentibacter chungangensis TaxID=1335724 RepID=A0ABW3NUA2_9FLAO
MKAKMPYIKLVFVLLLAAFLFGFAENRHKGRNIKEVGVQFTESENLYVTEQAVNKLLIQNNQAVTSIVKETLDLNRVESILNNHDMIENAEVYLTLDGKLRAKVSQRKPIARVVGGSSFYLDRNGKVMPLSPNYSARVPLLFGFSESNVTEVYPITKYIRNDEFLTRHITAVRRLNNGRFELELRKLDFSVYFGEAEDIDLKFNNFKAFYKKALKDEKLNTYRKVNLQFGNQVVCTKK